MDKDFEDSENYILVDRLFAVYKYDTLLYIHLYVLQMKIYDLSVRGKCHGTSSHSNNSAFCYSFYHTIHVANPPIVKTSVTTLRHSPASLCEIHSYQGKGSKRIKKSSF